MVPKRGFRVQGSGPWTPAYGWTLSYGWTHVNSVKSGPILLLTEFMHTQAAVLTASSK